jgi:CRP/FNR family transcriptional regulator, nitrogen fixation regulation protein
MKMHASSTRIVTEHDSHRKRYPNHPDLTQRLASLAIIKPCRRGEEICRQGHPAESWYRLVSGTARLCAVRADGRRQIIELLLAGDFFGFTTANEYDFTVEAVTEGTKVASFPRQRLELLADSDPQLAREIRQVAFETLSRMQSQLLTLGRITALEKVGSFLLELASRSSERSSDKVTLPISRYDIADYLALSVETVSRSLTDLKNRGVIRLLSTRMVMIVDRDALDDCDHHPHAHQYRVPKMSEKKQPAPRMQAPPSYLAPDFPTDKRVRTQAQ